MNLNEFDCYAISILCMFVTGSELVVLSFFIHSQFLLLVVLSLAGVAVMMAALTLIPGMRGSGV